VGEAVGQREDAGVGHASVRLGRLVADVLDEGLSLVELGYDGCPGVVGDVAELPVPGAEGEVLEESGQVVGETAVGGAVLPAAA
jgi:hypothetical protein